MAAWEVGVFSELPGYLADKANRFGCFVDTSILFSETYTLDRLNEEADMAFDLLVELDVPVFTNINVRAEFLEAHRRVLIAECLIDFLDEPGINFDGVLFEKLKSHRTAYRRRIVEEKSAKMELSQIKMFRKMLLSQRSRYGNAWELFCRDYLLKKMEAVWPQAENELGLNFISLRSGDRSPYLNTLPEWSGAVRLMGQYGIGSADAMILNMFLCSKLPFLLTADEEMADCAVKESKGTKRIFIPDSATRA